MGRGVGGWVGGRNAALDRLFRARMGQQTATLNNHAPMRHQLLRSLACSTAPSPSASSASSPSSSSVGRNEASRQSSSVLALHTIAECTCKVELSERRMS